ncbi:hypothetical protein CEW89_18015 [Celeribacter ethanolicus]|uniref:Uncharacterized protein n=1 Tax=Celeribacter ethanolicus TaxID=1758178 RepID=A0A291GGI5_9RHOB|nr:hypothetical protein [Celeribacter ethanolicus]ATG49305.1 hypothetical protein CEW89_18015 [Celeribacter ethanolicus]
MKTLDNPKLAAGVWALVGLVSAPSVLLLANWARFQSSYPDYDRQTFAYVVAFVVNAYLLIYTFKRLRIFGTRDFSWKTNHAKIFPRFALVFALEAGTYYAWNFSDFISGVLNQLGIYSVFPSGPVDIEFEEPIYIFLLLVTLPLTTWLVRAYLDFLQSWIAAALAFWGGATPEPETETEQQPIYGTSPQSAVAPYQGLEQQIENNINRATLKSYVAMFAMVITVVAAVIAFQYVFQSSATTRATQLIQSIETSPVALSATFSDRVRNLKRITARIQREERQGHVVVVKETSDSNSSGMNFEALDGESLSVESYLNETFRVLQSYEDVEEELPAELRGFLSQLSELRTELANTARTNWDLILLRTAIVLVALVSVKIFHTVMMSENRERHYWEARLIALKAIQSGALSEENIANYLAVVGNAPTGEKVETTTMPSLDLDKLAEKIVDALTKKE